MKHALAVRESHMLCYQKPANVCTEYTNVCSCLYNRNIDKLKMSVLTFIGGKK